jgi:NADPH:quinone reductase-like Zn-dependent oxidoreductase
MFSAVLIEKGEAGQTVGVAGLDEAQLSDGSDGMVSVDVECSTLNYKDGLAITRKSPVVRKFPMNACAQTRCGGAVAACGLAQGMDFPATVTPFILRGVSLLGIDSVTAPKERRMIAWKRLSDDLDGGALDSIAQEIGLGEAIASAGELMDGKVRGRIVVAVNR